MSNSSQRNISYFQSIDANIRTLSIDDADGTGRIGGLLYVPDLNPSDPCSSSPYVPTSATTQEQLPATDFNLIALAPWYNTSCTLQYFESARYDPIRAFIFYIPDNGTSIPPPLDDPIWDLNDGGQWKQTTHFPVYAIPGAIGASFMEAISLYSGNVSSVPLGSELIDLGVYPSEFVRVYTHIKVTNSTSLPRLWSFLLIVCGVLLIVVVTTCMTMALLQRARRKDLKRRVMRGQANLEALGLKRLTVPTHIIEAMPLFVYTDPATSYDKEEEALSARHSFDSDHSIPADSEGTSDPSTVYQVKIHPTATTHSRRNSSSSIATTSSTSSLSNQPTCLICIQEFESTVSVIRELPCGHIFHPECIDTLLAESTSLCPLCKRSCFPVGYCPISITNGLVQRERALRRLRSKVRVTEGDTEAGYGLVGNGSVEPLLRMPPSAELPLGVRRPMALRSGSDARSAIDFGDSDGEGGLGRAVEQRMSRRDIARARADELAGGVDFEFEGADRWAIWRRS